MTSPYNWMSRQTCPKCHTYWRTCAVSGGKRSYVRCECEKEIRGDFLLYKELRTTTTTKDVFDTLDDFMRNN